MPKKPRRTPEDVNQVAHRVVADTTGEARHDTAGKDPAAVALGRRGGLKGGKARAAKLTKERRQEIARKAAAARWGHRGK